MSAVFGVNMGGLQEGITRLCGICIPRLFSYPDIIIETMYMSYWKIVWIRETLVTSYQSAQGLGMRLAVSTQLEYIWLSSCHAF